MERERITISIKKGILDKIDSTIDGLAVRNRSHAIENIISNVLGKETLKNAVILAGGKGARKMIPMVIESIAKLKSAGFTKIYIALGSLAADIKDKIGEGENLGVLVKYIATENGSGGALSLLKQIFDDTFIVINQGDNLDVDIKDVINFHKTHKSIATVATDQYSEFADLKGVYIFEPTIFESIPKGFSMLEEDVLPELAKKQELVIYPII